MSFSKFFLEMVCDLSHCHKIPLETQKATLSKEKMLKDSSLSQKIFFKVFFEAHRLQKAIQFVAVPRGGICWHQKCHFASSISKATWSRVLLQTGKAVSSIRSYQNQTKTARSFKIAKRRVHMMFRAISTPFGLTSILQWLNRSSWRRQFRRYQIFDQILWMVSKYLQKTPRQSSSQTDTVWPSINSRTAKSSLPAARTSDAATHQTKHMSSFCMLPKGCTSNFRSFRQHLTQFWCSEAK